MSTRFATEPDDIVVTALVKGSEKYVVTYHDTGQDRAEALKQFGRWASNPDLSFSWYDAAVLARKVRSGEGGAT